MAKTFLGKSYPKVVSWPKPKALVWSWGAAFLLLGSLWCATLSIDSSRLVSAAPSPQSSEVRYLADAATLPTPAAASATDPCASFTKDAIFPLLPDQTLKDTATGFVCTPAYWNLYVVGVIIDKFLGLLNWLAGALAILLTTYAGILYLGGFANEANIKQAKAILVATYVGFAIVISARLIIGGSLDYLCGGGTTNTCVNNALPNPAPGH